MTKGRQPSGSAHARGKATAYRRLSEPAYRGDFVARYGRLRPTPPADLLAMLTGLARAQPPALVVDLGSGTGISTVAWSGRCERVIGIERNPEMLAAARPGPNVEYRHASADATGLPDGCADVVTCAQSFHWMEHRSTIAEIARILRPEGVFAAYDYDWPPLVHWRIDQAFLAVIEASGIDPLRPEKAGHAARLRDSRRFRSVREFYVHRGERREAEQIALLPFVFGPIVRRLNEGVTEEDLGLDRWREVVDRNIESESTCLWWSYRVHAAVK